MGCIKLKKILFKEEEFIGLTLFDSAIFCLLFSELDLFAIISLLLISINSILFINANSITFDKSVNLKSIRRNSVFLSNSLSIKGNRKLNPVF